MINRPVRLALTLASVGAAPAWAQHLEGTASTQHLTWRFGDGSSVGEHTGVMVGARGAARFGVFRVALGGVFGEVRGPVPAQPVLIGIGGAPGATGTEQLRMTDVSFGAALAPWLEIGAEAVARRMASDTGVTLQQLGGAYARARAGFGGPFSGTAELAYYPVSRSRNTDPVTVALRARIGAQAAPRGSPLVFGIAYALLRIDHGGAGGAPWLEQDQALVVEMTLRR